MKESCPMRVTKDGHGAMLVILFLTGSHPKVCYCGLVSFYILLPVYICRSQTQISYYYILVHTQKSSFNMNFDLPEGFCL